MAEAPPMLGVGDVESAVAWWEAKLGFTTTFRYRTDAPESTVVFAVVARDDVEIHLARRAALSDRSRTEITIVVADLHDLVEELIGRGLSPRPHPTGGYAVSDPAGNRIVVTAPGR